MMLEPPYCTATSAKALRGSRVLITGASGFVGGHILRQGLAAGLDLHVLGRSRLPDERVSFLHADLTDRAAVHAAASACAPDLVVHLASPGVAFGTADYREMTATLTLGAEALLSACAELPRPPHVIHVGTGFEYAVQDRPIREDDPILPSATRYGAAKAAAAAVTGGFAGMLPISMLRPFNLFGAGDIAPRLGSAIIAQARAGQQVKVSAGEQVRDFLHVDDFGELVWKVAAAPPPVEALRLLNVGSGAPRPLHEYIQAIAAALRGAGIEPEIAFGAVPYRPGEPMIAVPDLTRLHSAFDWQTRVPFADGITDYVRAELARCP